MNGSYLRGLRDAYDLTNTEISGETGIDAGTISKILNEAQPISEKQRMRILVGIGRLTGKRERSARVAAGRI